MEYADVNDGTHRIVFAERDSLTNPWTVGSPMNDASPISMAPRGMYETILCEHCHGRCRALHRPGVWSEWSQENSSSYQLPTVVIVAFEGEVLRFSRLAVYQGEKPHLNPARIREIVRVIEQAERARH